MTDRTEYAIVIDETYDAVLIRNLLQREADKLQRQGDRATRGSAQARNHNRATMYRKYAERCEHIRLQAVEEITSTLGGGRP